MTCESRPRSAALFEAARQKIPGGVNSPARAFGGVGGTPVFIARGEGPHLYDVDGNRYVDYIGSWGPMILGHAHPAVREAIHAAIDLGTSYGAPTERETELAAELISAVPSVEKVRLVNSGTEATMSAIRLARGYTGRDRILKFAGNYHGHVDSLLVAAGSSAATLSVPNSPGVTAGTARDTLIADFNHVASLEAIFAEHGEKLAAVIVEPVVGNMGCVPPRAGFLETLRELTLRHGTLLVFDEVMTGFRLAIGGAQEVFGVTPDLTTLGKIIGGGLPLAAYGGRAEIMDHVLPAGKVFQAGTLSGNPLATAAGLATVRELQRTDPYARLGELTARLADGICHAAIAAGIPHQAAGVGSMWTFFFTSQSVVDWNSARLCNTTSYARFFHGMLNRGFYLPCSQYEAWFVSAAHTESLIDQTIAAAAATFAEMSL